MEPASSPSNGDQVKAGELVVRSLFTELALLADKKVTAILSSEPLEKPLTKCLQRGEDAVFDNLLQALGSVAEHSLPSLMRTLFEWRERQLAFSSDWIEHQMPPAASGRDSQSKNSAKPVAEVTETMDRVYLMEKRDLAVEFIFCLVLIEVLKQFYLHPGHEDLTTYIENLAFKQFRFRKSLQSDPNAQNVNIIADLYSEVIGVLIQTRFHSVRKHFMSELRELRSKEFSPLVAHEIISLLMGMKFFRVKMVPIEDFEACFSYLQDCCYFFLEVKDKDIKHALAGLFVEILSPVAAVVKNEVNVPCLKNFVETLYTPTLELCNKKKYMPALFPLVTCLLGVSQKMFFLQHWHTFLLMCLTHLKNRDPKMSRVALESLYRLLWVYMIRIKCESNVVTTNRIHNITNSLFPKGSKTVIPRDTPLNIFVKIILFISQERLDFAMREIVFDLLSVGRPFKFIISPERMSIGLRAFLVIADNLQQKEGDPPMPGTVGVLPSGNTVRVKKTFLNKTLTEEEARNIGINQYYPAVRKALTDILKALDLQLGRPLMLTSAQNVTKEIDRERKPKIDLFRTCVAAIPRLMPDGLSKEDLVNLLSRLTLHIDDEMRVLAFQALQNLITDFPDWRPDVVEGFLNCIQNEIGDSFPELLDNSLRMLLQLLSNWKNILDSNKDGTDFIAERCHSVVQKIKSLALVMLCNGRTQNDKVVIMLLKETRSIQQIVPINSSHLEPAYHIVDRVSQAALDSHYAHNADRNTGAPIAGLSPDLQWLLERNGGYSQNLLQSDGSLSHTGRSLQIFKTTKMPLSPRVLADILSLLVETVSEQGEDMQGYVTELMLTLEASVDAFDSEESVEVVTRSGCCLQGSASRKSAPPLASDLYSLDAEPHSVSCSFIERVTKGRGKHPRSNSVPVGLQKKGQRRDRSCDGATDSSPPDQLLGRSKSAQSFRGSNESLPEDCDRNSMLAKYFWIAVAMLETDYEHEFLLAVRLLDKTLAKLPLEKSDSREKVEKLWNQIKWLNFPGIHSLLLKGCTSPNTYDAAMKLLHKLTPLLHIPAVDPSDGGIAFPFSVMALLPYLLSNFDEPNTFCASVVDSFARWSSEKSPKSDNLVTVLNLYSRRLFNKESFQWTKCIVKYLFDAYPHVFEKLLSFMLEVADRGPSHVTGHSLSVIYCILNYLDVGNLNSCLSNELAKLISRCMDGLHAKEALKLIKLIVSRSSSFTAAPSIHSSSFSMTFSSSFMSSSTTCIDSNSMASSSSFPEAEVGVRRELPGRTMYFTVDLEQFPIVGRTVFVSTVTEEEEPSGESVEANNRDERDLSASPKKSLSRNPSFNDSSVSNWRRPWSSQVRTRERLFSLLICFGQSVVLPKSPSVIFSQTSDGAGDRQSSEASSTEDISAGNNEVESKAEESTPSEFALFKDFDFLEYELESQEGEGADNFNWGVRRRSLSNLEVSMEPDGDGYSSSPVNDSRLREADVSSDDELSSASPFEASNELALLDSGNQQPSSLTTSGHRTLDTVKE